MKNRLSVSGLIAYRRVICRTLHISLLIVAIGGCASISPTGTGTGEEQDAAPSGAFDWGKVKYVTPKSEPISPYGNPGSYEQNGKTYYTMASAENYKHKGIASWYGTKFHGRRTSSGETYDMFSMTAAHKTLPIPCYAKVTNLDNGKHIIVKINDRGPFHIDRIIDLSYAAAHKLEMTQAGTANVEVETITFGAQKLAAREQPAGTERYVQVGAYSNNETAQKLAKVLDREIRLPVKITHIKRNGQTLYRVRIGPIPLLETAEQLVSTLDIKELGTPSIVYE